MIGRIRQAVVRALEAAEGGLDRWQRRRFSTAPLCAAPMATPDEYRRRWLDARARVYPAVDGFERDCGVAIDADWFHDLALVTQVAIKRSETCYQHGRLLYTALRRYLRTRDAAPVTIVETGTARGFSALCMAKALDDAGCAGRIVSFDVLPHDAPILWNCIRDAKGPQTRAELLRDYAELIERYIIFQQGDTKRMLARMAVPRTHLVFLDSVHTYDHVMAEFAAVSAWQQPGDLLFFDDYTVSAYPGVVRAADDICARHRYHATVIEATPQRRYLIAEKL